jgi:hypothetical protein
MRNILSQAVTPEIAAQAALPEMPAMGPMRPEEILAPYPAQPAIEAQPARFEVERAIPMLAEAGLGPEALELRQAMRTRAGALPASLQEYQAVQAMTPEQQELFFNIKRGAQITDIGGVPHRFIPGRGMIPLSTLEAEAAALAEKERGRGLGELAVGQVKQAAETLPKISRNIRNLDEVIRLIEKEGAVTGPVASMFPSFRAASVELDNMQKELGLDVIGAVTFGALSKGELDLALSKGLPTHLRGKELVDWANRKKAAQEKLRDYYQEQLNFLSKPGNTIANWYEAQAAKPKYKVGDIVTAPNGQKVIIRSLKTDGTPDDVDIVR